MLVVIMAALFLARARREACHALMAVAISMKLAPLYYVKNVLTMRPRTAVVFVAILLGACAAYFVWDNYVHLPLRQRPQGRLGLGRGVACVRCRSRSSSGMWRWLDFDRKTASVGLVLFAMLLALKMNTARHR